MRIKLHDENSSLFETKWFSVPEIRELHGERIGDYFKRASRTKLTRPEMYPSGSIVRIPALYSEEKGWLWEESVIYMVVRMHEFRDEIKEEIV